MKTQTFSALSLALFGIALAGCSSASGEDASSTSEASTSTKTGSIAGTLFTTMQTLMKVNDVGLAVNDGNVVFTPSAPIATYMGGPVSFGLPTITQAGNDSFTDTSLDGATLVMSGHSTFALDVGGDAAIDMDVRVAGTVVARRVTCTVDGCTTAKGSIAIPLSNVSIHVRFTIASGGVLSVGSVSVSLPGAAAGDCSAETWCSTLWSGHVGEMQGAWALATRNALAAQLAAHQSAWIGALDATINSGLVRIGAPDAHAPPPWHVVPSSLAIASAAFDYTAKREYATTVPTSCTTYSACEGYVGVTCASSTDDLTLQFESAGQWTFTRAPSYIGPATTSFSWSGKGSFEEIVRVCATNSTGSSCTGPIAIFPNSNHCPPVNVPTQPPSGTL
jgi:hypothetical protein